MATIPTIQLFRNSIIKTGRQAAIDALEAQKASVADGGLILARYSSDGKDNNVKTLLGIVRNSGSGNADLTVIDVEGAAENVQSAITSAIDSLNKGDAEVEGEYVSSVSEDKGIITVTRQELPSFDEKSNSGKAITAITQTKGLVDVKFGGVAAANVSVADSIGKFDSDNVEGALLEIKNSLDNAIGTGGTVEKQISDAINALNSEKSGTSTSNHITVGVEQVAGKITSVTVSDSDIASAELLGTISDTKDKATAFGRIAQEAVDRTAAIEAMSLSPVSGTGKVITAITQTNGVVNATADTLSASFVAFTASNTAFKSSNVKDALDTLYAQSGEGSKVTLESAEGTESGVLKVYTIKQGGSEVGKINIPKDLVVTSGSVVKGNWNDGAFTEDVSGSGTALKLVIANQEAPVYINTLDLVKDHIAGNGIAISDTNEISVKRDTASENFLTVGADGVKLDGVQNAISAASGHVNTIIDARLGTGVTSESTATDQFAALSGQITSINATIDSLDATVTGGSTHVDVTVGQANGIITSVTVANNDIASADELAAETTNRQNQDDKIEASIGLDAEGNHKTTTGNYTNGATTVVGEIAALDTKLKEVSDTLGTGVSTDEGKTVTEQLRALSGTTGDASGVTSVEGAKAYAKDLVNSLKATVESTTKSTPETTTTEAIKIVQTNGKIASITLGAFDCGTY